MKGPSTAIKREIWYAVRCTLVRWYILKKMSSFKHLQIIGCLEVQERILDVLVGLKPWLQGNAKVADADENGIIQIWTDQIDAATWGIRRLIYEGVSTRSRSRMTRQNLNLARSRCVGTFVFCA